MLHSYDYPTFEYVQSEEQKYDRTVRHKVVVIGGGPVGLTAALDLAVQGIPVVLLDDNNTVSVGSRAVCYAKRPLEIWDRLGCADRMIEKGVRWQIGKVFRNKDLAYQFDLLPEQDHKAPAFINLQQYYLEQYLVDRCHQFPDLIDLRWKSKVCDIKNYDDYVELQIETPDGIYDLEADWVIACDGASSDTRSMLGLDFEGQVFHDRFLIADVVMQADFPAERWFWFDPPFHPGQSVLLHMQPENVWRIDFQLGWDCDPEEEKKPEKVLPRLKAMLGENTRFELEWVSVYQFACRRMDSFRTGRVLFAGDSAHQVSPFGARGANTGVQDVDNLVWKLKLVIEGKAPTSLLDSYCDERIFAADDNIKNSTRSTDFISPKSKVSTAFRDATLDLAKNYEFARPLVNSGRLSTPTPYIDSKLNTPDEDPFSGPMSPGVNCADAPILVLGAPDWFLKQLGGMFIVLTFDKSTPAQVFMDQDIPCEVIRVGQDIQDPKGILTERYEGSDGTTYLIRPDQYICARWREFDPHAINKALKRATGQTTS